VNVRQAELDKLKKELQIKYRAREADAKTDQPVNVRVDVKHNEPFTVSPPRAKPALRERPSSGTNGDSGAPGEITARQQRMLNVAVTLTRSASTSRARRSAAGSASTRAAAVSDKI
jgi:hypothetical protein